jgi:glycogen debranching enzyme
MAAKRREGGQGGEPSGMASTPDDLVQFGREITRDVNAAASREWLCTNGLGGFASGAVAGLLTRRYHGLLVVEARGRHLLTSFGLRSLGPAEPGYGGRYEGGPAARDGRYHQGTGWGWLLGPFALAHLRVYGDRTAARALLDPMANHLSDFTLGSIAEIFDGEAPFSPRGCPAQAWSVAEVLRAWAETA